nr:MAG TPA: hypothetical protein [Caudoviricetes sp.]
MVRLMPYHFSFVIHYIYLIKLSIYKFYLSSLSLMLISILRRY